MKLQIQENFDLKPLTTFKIGGIARYFLKVDNKNQLKKGFLWASKQNLPVFLLGGGSNVLVSDKGFNGLIIQIHIKDIKKIEDNKKVLLKVGAGCNFNKLVSYCLKNDLRGMEWAVGIPGQLGGAVFGNAGAYGGCIGDYCKKVEIFSQNTFKYINGQNKFSYRNSYFKENNLIIVNVFLNLLKGITDKDKKNYQKWKNIRIKKQAGKKTPGCVFKNVPLDQFSKKVIKKYPEFKNFNLKAPAGWLIDKAGLKGKRIGDIIIDKDNANFMINIKNGKSKDVKKLINFVKQKVKNKFGVLLKEEIQYIENK